MIARLCRLLPKGRKNYMLKETRIATNYPRIIHIILDVSNMKRKYDKPAMRVVLLQHKTTLLADSNPVINPDLPNKPAGARGFDGFDDWDDWDE